MPATVVVGAQFGDEGKGKIVTYLAKDASSIIRFNGGANAGHTVYLNGKKIVSHLLPCGGLYQGKNLYLGPGMVIDPEALLKEIQDLKNAGGLDNCAIYVDLNAYVVM